VPVGQSDVYVHSGPQQVLLGPAPTAATVGHGVPEDVARSGLRGQGGRGRRCPGLHRFPVQSGNGGVISINMNGLFVSFFFYPGEETSIIIVTLNSHFLLYLSCTNLLLIVYNCLEFMFRNDTVRLNGEEAFHCTRYTWQ